jgi:hypothetical protein
MSRIRRVSPVVAAALASGSLVTAIAFWASTSLMAQTPAGPSDSIPVTEVPFYSEWAASPHAQKGSVPFTYWNNKKGDIPVACAGCHSTHGFLDLLGADGSTPGKVDRPAPT